MFSSEVKPAQAEQLLVQRNLRAEAAHEASRQTYKLSVKTKESGWETLAGRHPVPVRAARP